MKRWLHALLILPCNFFNPDLDLLCTLRDHPNWFPDGSRKKRDRMIPGIRHGRERLYALSSGPSNRLFFSLEKIVCPLSRRPDSWPLV